MVNDIPNQSLSLVRAKSDAVDKEVIKPIGPQAVEEVKVASEEEKAIFDALVAKTASQLNVKMQSIERDLQFNVDETNGDTIITVLDTKTKEVIRQIPTEEVLAIRENIESLKGILFSAEV